MDSLTFIKNAVDRNAAINSQLDRCKHILYSAQEDKREGYIFTRNSDCTVKIPLPILIDVVKSQQERLLQEKKELDSKLDAIGLLLGSGS